MRVFLMSESANMQDNTPTSNCDTLGIAIKETSSVLKSISIDAIDNQRKGEQSHKSDLNVLETTREASVNKSAPAEEGDYANTEGLLPSPSAITSETFAGNGDSSSRQHLSPLLLLQEHNQDFKHASEPRTSSPGIQRELQQDVSDVCGKVRSLFN